MTTSDLTKSADLTRHGKGTGALRTRRPDYVDFLPPCNAACPAGENIQAWLALAQGGDFEAAWRELVVHNPMPSIHGRVCYHPCEDVCNRAITDSAISIHAVERFLGDLALENGWQFEKPDHSSGLKILIVGAGPSGLSAAYHLAGMGHAVEIREAGPVAGGMINFGIPAYRMPREELRAEISRIENMGVTITLDYRVTDVLREKEDGGFDAVFIAVGAHISKKIDIPTRDASKILDAVSFLSRANEAGDAPKIGRRVAIYGGGNTAMDAARTAKRLGADEAIIIYRRDRSSMPAHDFEADEALEEGVKINWLRTIKEIDRSTFKVEIMKLDDDGRPQPTGEFESLEADSLILAVGQDTDTAFLESVPGIEFKSDHTVIVDNNMMTGHAGIFAGGDMVPSDRSVTIAVGHGKHAARHIDAYLKGSTYRRAPRHPIIGPDKLQLWYRTLAPQVEQERLPILDRQGFDEIMQNLSEADALFESRRCLSCGNCFECDGCFGACPETAIIKLGPGKRYRFDFDLCTGCATCYEQCPCHAIEMIDEPVEAQAT